MRILRALARAAVRGRCPHCGGGALFRGYYATEEACSACHTRYDAQDGAWLGALALGYGIGAVFAILATFAEVAWGPLQALGLDPTWGIVVASVVVTAAGYRPAKGAWYAMLYLGGFMATPEAPAADAADAPEAARPRA